MIYITGDTHRDFNRIHIFCALHNTTKEDLMIVLGDAGINFYGGWRDNAVKSSLESQPITFLFVHGNHEMRPESTGLYETTEWRGGRAYIELAYPSLIFAQDGEVYDLLGKKALVIGGAYSVDKDYRLKKGWSWWPDEQPNDEAKARANASISKYEGKFDYVLTHTCPMQYRPVEMFLPIIDQSTVDCSTETYLSEIESRIEYKKWFCGHYHTDKTVDKVRLMFNDIVELDTDPVDMSELNLIAYKIQNISNS